MFEIGQRVKITGSESELKQYSAERGYGLTGVVIEIDDDADGITHRVKPEAGSMLSIWYKPEHLELVPDDGKPAPKFKLGDTVYLKFHGVTPHKIVEFGEFFDDDTQSAMLEDDLGQRRYDAVANLLTEPHILPDIEPAVIRQPAPLLRQKNSDGEVMSARNVLLKFPDLATRQPHLFLAGGYCFVTDRMLHDFLQSQPNSIVLDFQPDSPDDESKVYRGSYRVFVITEGE